MRKWNKILWKKCARKCAEIGKLWNEIRIRNFEKGKKSLSNWWTERLLPSYKSSSAIRSTKLDVKCHMIVDIFLSFQCLIKFIDKKGVEFKKKT